MKLMTKEIEKRLPEFYTTESVDVENKIIQVKYFNPTGQGTWYGVEYDSDERLFFGYASLFNNHNDEWGYFSLDELESIEGQFGLGIERDKYFEPKPFAETRLGKTYMK